MQNGTKNSPPLEGLSKTGVVEPFNEAKYKALLEGLEAVELDKSIVFKNNKYLRIDNEFFNKRFIKEIIKLEEKPNEKLINISNLITDFGAFSQMNFVNYIEKGVPFIRNQNVKDNLIDTTDIVYVDKKTYNKLSLKLEENDILIPRAGTLGNAAVVSKSLLPATANQNLAQIKPNLNKIKPYYLTTFLCSKFGLNQIERFSTGNVQQWLNLENINNIKIHIPSENFQNSIHNKIISSIALKNKSKLTYSQAENLLLETLGLKNFEPSCEPVNIKSFKESFGSSGRLDAEYYQKKYEEIEFAIKNYSNGYKHFGKFIENYSTGYPYKSETYIEKKGVPLIRINNINKGNLDISNAIHIPKQDINLSVKDIAVENDILISMSGTIGNSCKIPKGVKAVINQRIMRVTPKNYNNEVLPLIINSQIGNLQLNQIGTGGVQTNISSNDIKNILIPVLTENSQQQIADLVEKSFSLKAQSEQLLKTAKNAVEIAIEENEEIAMEYLKQEENKNAK